MYLLRLSVLWILHYESGCNSALGVIQYIQIEY